jgi:dTDP-4-dehydrorhamnose reductase
MILITGDKGFIGKNFINFYKLMENTDVFITLDEFKKIHSVDQKRGTEILLNVTKIIHCAGVSDIKDFKDTKKITEVMVHLTQQLVDIAEQYDIELVFCSSEAADKDLDIYGTYKRAMEFYIKTYLKKYKILRIPRIYDKSRQKGLLRQLKNNEVPEKDFDKEVEFIDLNDFIPQMYHISFKKTASRIYYFKKLQTKSIREIKNIYLNT